MENSKIILINKKNGISSHRAIKEVQKKYNFNKVGHAGTLDPMAEGLMIVMTNNATKLSDILMKKDKVYLVKMELGYETDTLDAEGKIIKEKNMQKKITLDEIKEVIKSFVGEIEQIPPIYSAIKVNGKKLYHFARKNEEIEIKPRKVKIYNICDITYNENIINFRAHVSSGTYIRSLVRDIAYKLNTYATMVYLLREKISIYNVPENDEVYDIPEIITLPSIYIENNIDVFKLINGQNLEKNVNSDNKMLHCYYQNKYLGIVDVVNKNTIKKSKFFVKREEYEKN